VNINTFDPDCAPVNSNEVLAARNDSDTEEFGWCVVTNIAEPAKPSVTFDFLILGTRHITGTFKLS
jgi:hypothetical protein